MKVFISVFTVLICSVLTIFSLNSSAEQIQLNPSKDNTIYSHDGTLSNGAGPYLHVARSLSAVYLRRALIAFDIADDIPGGSTINSVTLTLNLNKSTLSGNSSSVKLYRLLADWGESSSNAGTSGGRGVPAQTGDATWTYTFYATSSWSAAGSDFSATSSASKTIGGTTGFYTWGTTAQMVTDVQGWLDNPANNFGWLIKGDESIDYTGKRFCSRDNETAANRPKLTVNYTPPIEVTFVNGDDASLNFNPTLPAPPQNNWPFGQFCFSTTSVGAILGTVDITVGGTFSGLSGSTPFQLYASNTNNYGSASAIGSGVAESGGSITFSALNDALPSGTRYYWVTVDLGADATGNINGSINNSSAITLSNGALGGSSCYGLLNAGGDPSLPVRLITFTANQHKYGVLLYWVTESQTDNLGFVLARRNNEEATWKSIASYKTDNALKGQGNSPDRAEYEFIDMNVKPEKTYYYRLSDVDVQGHVSTRGFAEIFVSDKLLPDETKLYPAFPNPFNALTRITYQLADEEKVTLSIFNITGRKIRNLSLDETQQQGLYSIIWDGKDVNGCNVPTGIYLIQLQAGSFTNTGKVLLLR